MSEQVDLEGNNLCIPEDAFEKFQSVSMYQEEECLLLPQKVPPSPKPPESYDPISSRDVNEVVLSSCNELNSSVNNSEEQCLEEQPLSSSCVESSIGLEAGSSNDAQHANKTYNYENDTDMVVSNSENVNNQGNSNLESPALKNVTPRKRGRKPKKLISPLDDTSAGYSKNIQNPDISSTPFSSDPESSDTVHVTRKRRGRPRKVQNEQTNLEIITKDLSSELSSSENHTMDDTPMKKPGKRGRPKGRGRKAQTHVDVTIDNDNQSVNLENPIEDLIEIHDLDFGNTNNIVDTISKKRKRKSISLEKTQYDLNDSGNIGTDKKLIDKVADDDLDNVCLSKLKSAPDQSSMSKSVDENITIENKTDIEVKDISSDYMEQPNETKKRRGRPKKSQRVEKLDQAPDIVSSNDINDQDDADDMCLSKLKSISSEVTNTDSTIEVPNTEIITSEVPSSDIELSEIPNTENQMMEVEKNESEMNGTPSKRNTKMPVMADFEYNIDSVIIENDNTDVNNPNADNSLLIEDTSKRPVRRKVKKLKYEEESDEDPFANIELSDDDEPRKGRRGNKYYSDDEYIPGKRGNAAVASTDSEITDSELHQADEFKKQRRRKLRKKSDNQSPRKRGKKDDEQHPEVTQTNDVEVCLEPAVIKASDGESQPPQPSHQWGTTTEFENFLAKKIQGTSLKIKKVSSNVPAENSKIEIPVLDPEAKKTIEMCTQTSIVPTTSTAVQTVTAYETPVIENIALTPEQSEKACYFLNSIVKTTAELGLLMTQKSEDFIKKKINTNHVTDTSKMDYCVKKSFLLFKLAKHNLLQMEEDLSKQYDQFLETNKLTKCREEQKKVIPTPKKADSDSDCEIVDVKPSPQTKVTQKSQPSKVAFNPKTVFLNKELSIKIAKKPSEGKKLDIKGRHTVWINDTVMVKKVKPTQSFLAQDSRNKKPPDYITTEMVSDFFKDYNRKRALSACAPFVTTDWLNVNKECVCNYFVVKPLQFNTDDNYSENDSFDINGTASGTTVSEPSESLNDVKTKANNTAVLSPETLFTLCFRKLKNQLYCNGLNHSKEDTHKIRHELTDGQNVPVTLFRLCVRTINDSAANDETTENIEIHPTTLKPESSYNITEITTLPLKSLCHRKIVELLADASEDNTDEEELYESNNFLPISSQEFVQEPRKNINGIKSLFSLCVQFIQKTQQIFERNNISISTPNSLKKLAFESVTYLLYTYEFKDTHQCEKEPVIEGLMINCVNSLSEEAFLNLQQYNTDIPDSSEYQDDFDNEDNFEADLIENDQDQTEPSWASQVQMQELRSCVNINNTDIEEQEQQIEPIITHIKLEPLEETADNLLDVTNVKSEPVTGPDEMTIIPDVKSEIEEHIQAGPIVRQNSSSYDVDAFEQFVSCNKLMKSLTEDDIEGVYSQSSERVRRQHEPDYYEESNIDMLDLLVPHTYEPMNIQTAKGSLMESSSDEGTKNTKTASKKVKRRGRPKKAEQKTNTNKVISTPPPVLTKEKEKGTNNEVALLTRKMKEKIRQQEKKDESTDSETENVNVRLRPRDKKDTSEQIKEKSKPTQSKSKNPEIQCNNVDSTDQIEDDVGNFTGFTSIETNEMSNYEKYMKFVYEKVIPGKEEEIAANKKQLDLSRKSEKPVISPDEPVELLECEPTIPMFEEKIDESIAPKKGKGRMGRPSKVAATVEMPAKVVANVEMPAKVVANVETPATVTANVEMPVKVVAKVAPYVDRHGWQCYPVDSGDSKLYQSACISLEKLPETFVRTYFEYQNIPYKDKFDEEIDRLTNLNSLNRSTSLVKKPHASKRDTKDVTSENANEDNDDSRTVSAVDSDYYDELQPSDDDGPGVEDEAPLPVQKQTENVLAKNLLMNDNESDDDVGVRVKKEILEETSDGTKEAKIMPKKKVKGPPELQEPSETSDLMLTADKMMNKELTLLHAPVVMDEKVKDIPNKGPVTRHTKKSGVKPSPPSNKMKTEEDSSSEEEKQWVTTKEKLLKRMGKKESASADDAKRAKLVSEFIERREGNLHDSHKRRPVKTRRSGKKFLERQKQLRVLQRELFGETSNDLTVSKRSVAAWKGRRNIRKVLDKKSLARSTVIANMEEFERKRRLNTRQTKLRELLGCEEGVNVLVINDEVCLEYDFEEHRPVVTIHPFFTKVMKAHQYEGVKFMWDACFESLSDMEAGHGGGGCILAHCMGLGKTLQVLALLHTVLTHPRVGMHRVLVCCPLSTVLNWVDEIHKWIGPVTNQIKVFELSKLKKTYERAYQLEDWYNGGGIFIIGYELFRSLSTLDPFLDDVRPTIVNKIRTALLDPGPDIIVCDEGHLLKNDCSVLAVSMSRVVTKRRIVLTGTPMQNNLREYYCMVNFVKPNLLGTYAEYSNRFENPIMNGQHRDSREEDIKLMKARTHILHKVLEGCLQRQEASVLYPYLPKKHEYTVFITLTKCQWDLYKHYMKHYSKQMKQNSILKDFHILQKIWSHPQVLHNFQTKFRENKNKVKMEKLEDDLATEDQEDIKDGLATELWWLQYLDDGDMLDSLETSNKFVVVFRILDECVALGDKVLIFSTSLFCLDVLEYFLKKINKWSLGHEYYRLDGSVPPEVRQKWCREFNADNNVNTKLFLVSTRAGCLGLNMTAANRVIIMDTSWNPAHDIQSIFRVYRFGQKKDCFIYRLVAMGTMEQKIYERSVTKQAVACRVVDEQQIDRHYNSAELTELYRYDDVGSTVAGGVAVGVSDVALLRVARETALHAVHEHDSLLRSSEQGLPEHERAAAWMQFQQEQTHKQMENKLIANIPKLSLKRLEGNNYVKADVDDVKQEIKTEETSDDFVPPAETKNKRGRKIKKLVIELPPKASTSTFVPNTAPRASKRHKETPGTSRDRTNYTYDENLEDETIVEQITEILIQHNFQNKDGRTDVAGLVSNVRRIVNQGYIYKSEGIDDLTMSIAKVLLSKRMSLPAATGIMCESINKSSAPDVPQEEPESILSTPTPTYQTGDSRKKRKAAIAAEKHIDSISQDIIINLDDEIDTTDKDFVPDRTYRKRNSKEVPDRSIRTTNSTKTLYSSDSSSNIINDSNELESAIAKSVLKPKPGPKSFKDLISSRYKELTTKKAEALPSFDEPDDRSISLSDEDEPLSNKVVSREISIEPAIPAPAVSAEDEEAVPLPLSLLTNKNFINIVAHTYLNGNPMLDADAATLAAQYSTYKSLKEAEQTGRDIVSGPIYDIAVKVIGKNLFKRMNSSTACKTVPVEEAHVTVELKEKMREMTEGKSRGPKRDKRKKERETKVDSYSQNSNLNVINSQQTSTNPCPNGGVVPVGLIKTTGSMQSEEFASECILPDDDLHIVPHELPPPAPSAAAAQPPPTTRPPIIPKKPIILNHILNSKKNLASKKCNVIKINQGKIVMPASVTSGNSLLSQLPVMPGKALSYNDTICLDSDEDEPVTPIAPKVTPIAPKVTPIAPKVTPIAPKVTPIAPKVTPIAPKVTPAVATATSIATNVTPMETQAIPIQCNLAPVPISLSTVYPTEMMLSTSSLGTPVTSTQGVPQKPLILRQIAAGCAPKFVLVPANSVIATTPPKLLGIETMTTTTGLKMNTSVTSAAPESILSTTTPSPAGLSKMKQARCRPGDIIKISDKGEIEVLQVNQLNTPAVSKQPQNDVAKAKPAHTDVAKAKPAHTDVAKTKPAHTDVGKAKPPHNEVAKAKPAHTDVAKSKPAHTYVAKAKPTRNDDAKAKPAQSEAAKPKSRLANTAPKPKQYQNDTKHKVNKSQNEVAKPKPATQKSVPTPTVQKEISKTRTLSISSSSSDSRPSSPTDNNPLSILKNVVHIQAVDETPSTSSENLKSKVIKTDKSNDANIFVQHVYENDVKKVNKTNAAKVATKQTKQSTPNTKDVGKSSSTTNNIFNDLLLKKSITLKSAKTDKKSATPLKSNLLEIKSTSGKNSKTVDLTHFNVSVGSGASILNTKIEAKKRASTTETSTPKKKKTEPMTLQDFSLDDIDDIIELD